MRDGQPVASRSIMWADGSEIVVANMIKQPSGPDIIHSPYTRREALNSGLST